jgi:hypothetical protein
MSTPRSIFSRASRRSDFFGSHVLFLKCTEFQVRREGALKRPSSWRYLLITPMMSDSFMISSSSPSILISVPDHLPNRTMSPLEVDRDELAALVAAARADGDDFALHRLLLGGVRNDDATLGLGVFFNPLDDNAVVQRTELHAKRS